MITLLYMVAAFGVGILLTLYLVSRGFLEDEIWNIGHDSGINTQSGAIGAYLDWEAYEMPDGELKDAIYKYAKTIGDREISPN